ICGRRGRERPVEDEAGTDAGCEDGEYGHDRQHDKAEAPALASTRLRLRRRVQQFIASNPPLPVTLGRFGMMRVVMRVGTIHSCPPPRLRGSTISTIQAYQLDAEPPCQHRANSFSHDSASLQKTLSYPRHPSEQVAVRPSYGHLHAPGHDGGTSTMQRQLSILPAIALMAIALLIGLIGGGLLGGLAGYHYGSQSNSEATVAEATASSPPSSPDTGSTSSNASTQTTGDIV